jgi:prepilin-type N-terminal cleavage/methylation domain-containing protein
MLTARTKGFTLVEIIVAVTILAVVLVSVFEIYSQIITTSKRLELARGLQQNTRTITESIASEVRNNGIAFECYGIAPVPGCGGSTPMDYATTGADTLILRGGVNDCTAGSTGCFVKYYLARTDSVIPSVACTTADLSNLNIDCYLTRQVVQGSAELSNTRLSDSLTRIKNLRFFVSGVGARQFTNSTDTEGKVTIAFTLSLAPRQGLDSKLADSLVIPVQTTITEKLYKSN